MTTRERVIEEVRGFLRRELLRDESAPIGAEEPLLSGGVITSFDLVALTVFLERTWGVRVPDSMVSREHLDTLEQIAALVLRLAGAAQPAAAPAQEAPAPASGVDAGRLFPAFRGRRGVLAALLIVAGLIGVDRAVDRAMTARRAPQPWLNYDYWDFRTAHQAHVVATAPKGADEVRILYQGSSATAGGEEACPAIVERLLRARDPGVRVFNTSYIGQSPVKDAEMFQVVRDYAPDVFVISHHAVTFTRDQFEELEIGQPNQIVYNRPLFREFLARVPPQRLGPELLGVDAVMADQEAKAGFRWAHRAERWSAIVREQLVLRALLFARLRSLLPQRAQAARAPGPELRWFAGKRLADLPHERPFELEPRAFAVLAALLDQAAREGVEVVLVREPAPTIEGSRLNWTRAGWAVLDQAFEQLAREHPVTLVNATDALEPALWGDLDIHWAPEGHEQVARAVADPLAEVVARVRARRASGR